MKGFDPLQMLTSVVTVHVNHKLNVRAMAKGMIFSK